MPHLDHPALAVVKKRFPGKKFWIARFRGQISLVVPSECFYDVMTVLRHDPDCAYNFLSDVVGVDYFLHPSPPRFNGDSARFVVIYNMVSDKHHQRLFVRVLLNPSLDTRGIDDDPALHLPSVCDLWPGAEWPEREVFDMFGIRFDGHPDLRRILTWETYPAHPLRKDYPLRGRGEREAYEVVDRGSA